MSFPVILASNSPARLMLLKTQKINPIVIPSEINEKDLENSFKDSPVSKIVLELSIAKAKNVLENNISLTEGILLLAIAFLPAAIIAFNIWNADLTVTMHADATLLRLIMTLIITFILMAFITLIGIWIPSNKAMHILPAEALHEE